MFLRCWCELSFVTLKCSISYKFGEGFLVIKICMNEAKRCFLGRKKSKESKK